MSKTINAGRVTFVPKDNFSNNISYKKFDIVTYNGSSYFAKKDTIGHTPTEEEFWQLVAEKGQNGAPGAVKMQVVDTLPETGETDTIYLVKKDNPGEQNLYDEYVYTDTGWEHIGDTSVDLSNYYTKEETDKKFNNKEPYVLNIETETGINVTSGDTLSICSDMINTLYNVGNKTASIILNNTKGYPLTSIVMRSISDLKKQSTGYTFTGLYNGDTTGYGVVVRSVTLNIYGTWNENIFTTNRVLCTTSHSSKELSRSNEDDFYLNKYNKTAYTPTGDYNPATKKYVDDQVGNINTVLATLTTVSEVTK